MALKSKICANSNGRCNCCVTYCHVFSAFCHSYILNNHTLVRFILHFFTIFVQFLSHVLHFETQWTTACQVSLSFTISWSLLKLMPIESVVPSNHLILCHSLLLLTSIFPSVRVFFQWVSSSHKVAKVLELQLSISPSNEYSGFIFFRIDWFDLLVIQGTFESPFQHHNSKASFFQCSAFFMVQLSRPYMTTGKKHSFDYTDLCQKSDVFAF